MVTAPHCDRGRERRDGHEVLNDVGNTFTFPVPFRSVLEHAASRILPAQPIRGWVERVRIVEVERGLEADDDEVAHFVIDRGDDGPTPAAMPVHVPRLCELGYLRGGTTHK